MMKKIFLLVAFLVFGKMWSYAQYPIQQFLGADSAIVTSKGGLQGRLIPTVITDTNAANAQRIKAYPGAQLYTTNGNFYIRNSNATKWILVSSGSLGPVNIYNSDGTLTGNRELEGDGYGLNFAALRRFGADGDSVYFIFPFHKYVAGNQEFILRADTGSFKTRVSYTGNLGNTFAKHSLIDKNYVDSAIASSSGGTVTNVATNNGSGITGGPITTTGTLAIDTTNVIATKASVSGGLAGKLNISDTATMLAPYLRKADTTSMLSPYFRTAGVGLKNSGQTVYADTLLLSTRAWRQKGIDSVVALISALPSGTVTSVATNNGSGITGGTITTSGTLAIDTTNVIATKASVAGGLAGKLNISDTATMLSPYLRKADTTSMLSPYFRTAGVGLKNTGQTVYADTLLLSTRAWRQKGIDSVAALITGGGYVTGSLVSGYLTKATGTNSIDTSQLYQSNGLVGIGTISPTQKLTVNGDASFNGVVVGTRSGNSTTVVGDGALTNSLASVSVGVGFNALKIAKNSWNTGIGTEALSNLDGGSSNTAIGGNAGRITNGGADVTSVSNSTYLGYGTTASAATGNTNETVIGFQAQGNGSNSVTLGNSSVTKTILRSNVGIGTTAPDSALTVVNGAYFQRGIRASGLPAAPGTKAVRIDANGTLSVSDTLVDAGGTVTSVATNNGTGITGGTITTTGTLAIDTSLISTRLWRQKGVDSVAGLLSGYVPTSRTLTINGTSYDLSANRTWSVGTVTSVATNTGTGITGGTITGSGTLAIDTLLISTRAWRQKGIDSVAALLPAAISGTTNYIPKFTSSSAIGNSIMYDDGSKIGIGTATPNTPLSIVSNHISGQSILKIQPTTAYASGGLSSLGFNDSDGSRKGIIYHDAVGLQIETGTALPLLLNTNGTERLRISSTGNVGIGTSTPTTLLDVAGVIRTSSTGLLASVRINNSTATTGKDWHLYSLNNGNFGLYNNSDGSYAYQVTPSGNLGLGVTPSAWGSTVKALQIGNYTTFYNDGGYSVITNNAFYNGTNNIYLNNAAASQYWQEGGQHVWRTAPSGTAGNAISFTQAMTLFSTGNLAVGGTSDNGNRLNVTGSGNFTGNVSSGTGINQSIVDNGYLLFYNAAAANKWIKLADDASTIDAIGFSKSGSAATVWFPSGNVGIGTTSPSAKLHVSSNSPVSTDIGFTGGIGTGTEYASLRFRADSYNWTSAEIRGVATNGGVNLGVMQFFTSDTERMRITSGGNVGIGTTSPNSIFEVKNAGTGASYSIAAGFRDNSTNGNGLEIWNKNGESRIISTYYSTASNQDLTFWTTQSNGTQGERMRITSGGEILVNTTTDAGAYYLQVNGDVYAGAYYESSDRRLKDILSVRGGSDGINTVTFKWKDQRDSLSHVGYIAQDVEKVLPDAVKTNPDGFKTVNYDEVQTFKIAALEKEIAELKEMLKKITDKK